MMVKPLVIGAVLIPFLVGCAVDPHHWATPTSAPVRPTVPTTAAVQPSPVPSQPAETLTTIYVVNNGVNKNWKLQEAVLSWQSAKYTVIKMVKKCPSGWTIPCVTINEVNTLDTKYAGEAVFRATANQMQINLNKRVTWISGAERQTTVCHEFGHILGLGHVEGSRKTCMYEGNYYRQWPLGATKLDIQAVDSLGEWDLEKMYESSGKTLDFRPKPR